MNNHYFQATKTKLLSVKPKLPNNVCQKNALPARSIHPLAISLIVSKTSSLMNSLAFTIGLQIQLNKKKTSSSVQIEIWSLK